MGEAVLKLGTGGDHTEVDVVPEAVSDGSAYVRKDAAWAALAWGQVGGTLADQTDLQTALNGKAATGHTHAAGDVVSGTFADARIAVTNVTQHQTALAITESQITDLGSYLLNINGEVIGDLSDVTVSAPAARHALMYSGSAWVNRALVWQDLPAVTVVTATGSVSMAEGIYRVSGSGTTLTVTGFRAGYPATFINDDATNSVVIAFNGTPSVAFKHNGTVYSADTITLRPGEFIRFVDYNLIDGQAYP